MDYCLSLIHIFCVSAHTIRNGGIAEAITKMTFGNEIGFKFNEGIDTVSYTHLDVYKRQVIWK